MNKRFPARTLALALAMAICGTTQAADLQLQNGDAPGVGLNETTPAAPVVPDARYAVRAFVLTWTELDSWWLHYDLDELAAQLTDEQAEAFYATAEGTRQFATDLHTARQQEPATPRLRAL